MLLARLPDMVSWDVLKGAVFARLDKAMWTSTLDGDVSDSHLVSDIMYYGVGWAGCADREQGGLFIGTHRRALSDRGHTRNMKGRGFHPSPRWTGSSDGSPSLLTLNMTYENIEL